MPLHAQDRRLYFVFLLLVAAMCLPGCRRTAVKKPFSLTVQNFTLQVGDSEINVRESRAGNSSLMMIHLHEDEQTAGQTARLMLEKHGGRLIQLVHSGQRRVAFSLDGAMYSFDPNRIFTDAGLIHTVQGAEPIPEGAYAAVKKFAAEFVRRFGIEEQKSIIAVHNNGEGFLSIHSYSPEGPHRMDSDKSFVNPNADPDNFYYVTDENLFNTLRELQFNVVLQKREILRDDGSLSVFAGRRKIPYINVEAQNEHRDEQIRMLETAVKITSES